MTTRPELIPSIRACLAGASASPVADLRLLYLAQARNLRTQLAEEIVSIDAVLDAQEAELARLAKAGT